MSLNDQPHTGLSYTNFIAKYIDLTKAVTYLEVGVASGSNLSEIVVDTALGVDPAISLTTNPVRGKRMLSLYQETSDDFFASSAAWFWRGKLDIVLLDGMHLAEYLLRDFYNAEAMIGTRGIITMHDCLPFNEQMASRENRIELRSGPHAQEWTGDVWKVVPILKKYRPDLRLTLLDCAPTGLVCVSRLDPKSTVLRTRYDSIVRDMSAIPNDRASLEQFYEENTLVAAELALGDIDRTFFS